jgi:hypothetical protein
MVDRLEEIAECARRGQFGRIADYAGALRDVDREVPKIKRPDGTYNSAPARAPRFVHVRIPEDPLHVRTIIKNPYRREYPYRGVNFP